MAEDGRPAHARAEIVGLLSRLGGLRRVEVVRVGSEDALLSAIAAEGADHLVIVGHGTPLGLRAGADQIPWTRLHEALSTTDASSIYLAACHSAAVADVAGKTIRTRIEGEVDVRVIGPQVASDLMLTLPALDAAFEARFLDYLDARGGLDRYAALILAPEQPLSKPAECSARLEKWYGGDSNTFSRGECVYFIDDANSRNCHDESARHVAPCTEFTPSDQSRLNAEATPSARASYGEENPSGGASAESVDSVGWKALAQALEIGWKKNQTGVTLAIGKNLGASRCATLVSAEMFITGGLSKLLEPAIKSIRAIGGNVLGGSGSLLALRMCGNVEVWLPRFQSTPQAEAQIKATGKFDVRLSTYGKVELDVPVFRWTRKLNVGYDVGLSYPVSLSVTGGVRQCYNNENGTFDGLYWRVSIPFEAGGLGFFTQATAGWVNLGFRHEFTDKWSPTFEATGWCPPGSSFSPPGRGGSAAAALPPPAIPEVYRDLIAAGAARENADPSVIHAGELQEWILAAGILEVHPGSGTFNGLVADGALARLSIPKEIPPGALLLLDLTNADVRDALGLPPDDTIPRISLEGGVVVVGPTTSASPPTIDRCTGPYSLTSAAALHADVCAGLALHPLPVLSVRGEHGVVLPSGDLGSTKIVTDPLDEQSAVAYKALCGPSMDRAVLAACQDLRTYSSAIMSGGDMELLSRIHDGFTLTTRPAFKGWLTSACTLSYAGIDVDSLDNGMGTSSVVVHPDGEAEAGQQNAYACLNLDPLDYGPAVILPIGDVLDDHNEGNLVLANLAASAALRANAAAQKPSELAKGLPDVTGLLWRTICGPLGICHLAGGSA